MVNGERVYFEQFSHLLRPDKMIRTKVDEIRASILSLVRWPEMITFEEMNLAVPDPGIAINILSVIMARDTKRLLS